MKQRGELLVIEKQRNADCKKADYLFGVIIEFLD